MTERVLAYILIDIELGMTEEVIDALQKIDEATSVAVTTGGYDIVVLLETTNLEELYEITVRKIHTISGIKDTHTAVVEKILKV